MPLASRINNAEPKNKRSKMDRKAKRPATSSSSRTSINSSTNGDQQLSPSAPAASATAVAAALLTATTNGTAATSKNNTTNSSIENDDSSLSNSKQPAAVAAPVAPMSAPPTHILTKSLRSATAKNSSTTSLTAGVEAVRLNATAAGAGQSTTPLKGAAAIAAAAAASKNKILNSTLLNSSIPTTSAANLSASNSTINNFNDDTMMTDVSEANTTASTSIVPPLPVEILTSIDRGTVRPGTVLAVGENLSNQLGLGLDVDDRKKPQLVKQLPTNVIQIEAGGMHSACLTGDGLVYTFGCNDEFALGRDNDEEIDRVDLPEKCIQITAGDSHTAALSASGVVYAWGTFRDGSGVLGLEQKKIAKTPMRFKIRDKIAKISSGADHLVFLTSTGEVYTAGNSEHGQLGRVSKYNSCRGGRRGYDMILVPGLVRFGKRRELQGHRQIEDIWTSAYGTYLKVKDSELIIGFGLNNCFQLGIEDAENRYQPDILHTLKFAPGAKLRKVIGGMHHTLFLDTQGHVYAMGSHRYGCLGLGKAVEADVKQPALVADLHDVVDIAANTNVSYAIDKHGRAYNWGTNYSKQLGQDTEDDYYVPTRLNSRQLDVRDVLTVSIGGQHALFIVSEEKEPTVAPDAAAAATSVAATTAAATTTASAATADVAASSS